MQQELIEMLEEIIPYVAVWKAQDQEVIDKAEALIKKAKNNAPAQEVSDKHEREMLEVIDERDRIHEWADQLADAIAKHTGYEIGEHTSANNPWRMALNALVCHEAKQEVTLTDERLREIDDAHNWQTTEGRMAAYRAIIAALREKGQV